MGCPVSRASRLLYRDTGPRTHSLWFTIHRRSSRPYTGSDGPSRLAWNPPVRHPMRHVPRRDVAPRGLDVDRRIIEEQVRTEGFEERPLVATAEKQRLVDAHAPPAQRQDHAFVRGRRARGNQRRADGRILGRERRLQAMQRRKKIAERSARQRFVPMLRFVAVERIEPLLL